MKQPFRAAVIVLLAASSPVLAATPGISSDDASRIRAVHEAYRAAWLANDAARVLALFSDDAVLMPHHGIEPVVGMPAIRAFWFPPNSPPVAITELEQPIDALAGSGDVAWVRGHSRVAWTTGRGTEAKSSSNAGTFLTLLRRQADGSWKIQLQMWDDPPTVRR